MSKITMLPHTESYANTWVTAGLHKLHYINAFSAFFFLYGKFSVSVIYLIHPATGWSGSLNVSSTCAYTCDIWLFYKSVPPWSVHHAALNTVTGSASLGNVHCRSHCNFLTPSSPSTTATQLVTDLQNSEKLLRCCQKAEKSPKN